MTKPSRSDQLVFRKQPRVANVVFQLASREKLGLGERYERRWDKARERRPRIQQGLGEMVWSLGEQDAPDGPSASDPMETCQSHDGQSVQHPHGILQMTTATR